MTGLSADGGEYGVPFVKRRHVRREDAELLQRMASQEAIVASVDKTRRMRGVTVLVMAAAAGISVSSYWRALSGTVLLRAATLAKLKRAQRRAAAGYLA